jgi:putative flippase GtrA
MMKYFASQGRGLDILFKFVKFGIVGLGGILVNTLVLFLLYQIARLPLVMASAAAVEAAIVNNFVWNNHWTFEERGISLHRFAKFNFVSLGGLVITTLVLYYLVSSMSVHYLVANLLAVGAGTLWNFGLSLYWTWG